MSSANARNTIPNLRWYICGLLFFATTINYIDRQVLGILKPVLRTELGWDEEQYGDIVFAFQLAYAIMLPLTGRLIDWLGTRVSYMLAVVVWSFAAMAHALASSAAGFSVARFALGFGEAGNFPAAIKTVSDWFPARERALATGIFNSGSNVGAIAAPLIVPWIAATWGWREAFVVTGALGFAWVLLWWWLYRQPRDHRNLDAAELAFIESDREAEIDSPVRVSYRELLRKRKAWAFMLGKFLTDPIWWFYLFWLPGFLFDRYNLNLTQLGPPLVVVYLAADVGSIGGGWLSSALLSRGFTVNTARKVALLVCAIAVTPAVFIMYAGSNLWLAVGLVSIAAAAHQGWSANLFTLASDLFPRSIIGSVVGLGGMGGAIGGMLFAPAVGRYLKWSGGAYGPVFVLCGSVYLVALLVIHVLVPRLEQDGAPVPPRTQMQMPTPTGS
ncbi:MAG: MFS transporter [Bryobacteraceae bacterium]|nr:MFS transporter [Bryobacteraceae bacterium]